MRPLSNNTQVRIGGSVILELGDSVGQGGEANIFGVAGEPHLAVKLLRTPGRAEHWLDDHLSIPAIDWLDDYGMPRLAWPIARAETLLRGSNGHGHEGHVMLRLPSDDWLALDALISGQDRARFARHFLSWDQLLVIARNVAELVADMHDHKRQIIAADLKTKNALVSRVGSDVALVDCDSMIVRPIDSDRHTIVNVGNPPVSEETVPPELLENALAARTVHTDAWAVAVIVCMLLMDGQHPFAGTPGRLGRKGNHSVTDNVQNGRTIFKPRNSLKITHPVYPRVLPVTLQELAVKCFVEGHGRPRARPTPRDWAAVLANLPPVSQCERLPRLTAWAAPTTRHRFSDHLRVCPWCELMAAGAPDAFPAVADGGNR